MHPEGEEVSETNEARVDFFQGIEPRECGRHHSTGHRAWCFDCTEWCYADSLCRGCELPGLRARAEAAEAELARVTRECLERYHFIRALVAVAGGKVSIPQSFLVDPPRELHRWKDLATGDEVLRVFRDESRV